MTKEELIDILKDVPNDAEIVFKVEIHRRVVEETHLPVTFDSLTRLKSKLQDNDEKYTIWLVE